MKTRLLRLAVLLSPAAALGSAGTASADDGHGTAEGLVQAATDVLPAVTWSLLAAGVFCLVLGILYLLKRQVGGFPENPSWVAPISIMRSRDLPAEDDSHDGHGGRDSHHAPAH
ncbi:hypothetical protein [Tepidiforma sp.]|uniref:hypothetical protein n=1 Tax=Tepidiforma sp. TaxID=2682230 RepID=UPI002ADD3CF0|nr:hypothetical protein [Tepidiforma sp.]